MREVKLFSKYSDLRSRYLIIKHLADLILIHRQGIQNCYLSTAFITAVDSAAESTATMSSSETIWWIQIFLQVYYPL